MTRSWLGETLTSVVVASFALSGMVAPQAATAAPALAGFSPRPAAARIPPLDKAGATPAQAAILAAVPEANVFRTLARHPALFSHWGPFGQYLLSGSSIPPRHREMAMLRMGWLCQAPYEWAAHAHIATQRAGMSPAQVRAVAEGPDAAGWDATDRAVLSLADELRYDGTVSEQTWTALREVYSDRQVLELILTAGQYQVISMALNTLGVQIDGDIPDTLPRDITAPATAARPADAPVAAARIQPRSWAQLSPAEQEIARPWLGTDGALDDLHARLMVHPRLLALSAGFSGYIEQSGRLPARARELLSLRAAWNQRAGDLWALHAPRGLGAGLTPAEIARIAQGPGAPGWSAQDAALLRAADDLRREAFVTDAAWTPLSKAFDDQQLIEIVFTVGAVDIAAMEIKALGVRPRPGQAPMPP